jgi:hypothetical protein
MTGSTEESPKMRARLPDANRVAVAWLAEGA